MRAQVAAQMIKAPERVKQEKTPEKGSKYHNIKTQVEGLTFDSRKEAHRYEILMKAQELEIIQDLRLQRDYTLQEAYTTPDGKRIRAIRYKADFTYKVCAAARQIIDSRRQLYLWFNLQDLDFWSKNSGQPWEVVEDVKSKATKTKTYIIKKKLMADQGHDIREV